MKYKWLSENLRKRWRDDAAYRQKMESVLRSDVVRRRREDGIRASRTPEFKCRMTKLFRSDKFRAMRRNAALRTWADPAVRRRRLAAMRKAARTAAHKSLLSRIHLRLSSQKSKKMRQNYKEGKCIGVAAFRRFAYRGCTFKSSWEKAFAIWCNRHDLVWQYEPKVFDLGTCGSYRPDFYFPDAGLWVEIKGLAFRSFWRKLVQFHRCFPHERIVLLRGTDLKALGIL